MSNLVVNICSFVFAVILADSSSVPEADKLPSPPIPPFLQEFFSSNPIFAWIFWLFTAFAIGVAAVATFTGNLQTIIDFVKSNLLRKPVEVPEEKQIKLRKQLLERLQSDISIRRKNSLHNLVKIDLEMEEQRHRIGGKTADLAPQDPEPENNHPLNRVFQFFNKDNQQTTQLKQSHKTIDFFDRDDIKGKLLILGEPGAGKTTELLSLTQDLIQRAIENKTAPIPVIFELSSWKNDQAILKSLNRSYIWDENIRNESELLQLVRKPLFLTMLVVAYQGRAIKNSSELFEAYIEQQLNNPDNQGTYPPRKSPSKKQTLHYLVWLARKLEAEGETEFLIEGMQPTWLESTKQKIMYREIVGMNIGIFFGVNFVFCCLSSLSILSMTPTFFESISELSMIFLALPMIGGLSGFLIVRGILIYEKRFGSLVNRNRVKLTYIKSTEKISWSFRKFLQIVKNSSLIGLKIGFCIGSLTIVVGTVITTVLAIIQNQLGTIFESILLYIGFYIGFCFLLIVEFSIMGLFFGLMIGIILGLIRSFVILELSNKNFPNQGIWNSLKHGLAISLGVGLFYSLFFGSLINTLIQRYRTIEIGSEIPRLYYIYREIAPTAISCLFCISIVIFLGLSLGLGSVIRHFSLRLMLYRNGNIPWNYAKFLDHATKHRFIQLVGGRYRFMHDLLRKHFAQMPLN